MPTFITLGQTRRDTSQREAGGGRLRLACRGLLLAPHTGNIVSVKVDRVSGHCGFVAPPYESFGDNAQQYRILTPTFMTIEYIGGNPLYMCTS